MPPSQYCKKYRESNVLKLVLFRYLYISINDTILSITKKCSRKQKNASEHNCMLRE